VSILRIESEKDNYVGKLNLPDRCADAFCGRAPRSIFTRHYADFNPELSLH